MMSLWSFSVWASWTAVRALHTDCAGTDVIRQDIWTMAREVDTAIQSTHIRADIIEQCVSAFFAIVQSQAIDAAIADCALGLAALAVLALPRAEQIFGTNTALEFYSLYDQLVRQYGHLRNAAGFSWSLESHQSAAYPMLLGLTPQTCESTDLKMFVYDSEYASRPLSCSQGMFASEVFVHRFFSNSDCRTTDSAEADFFFVPIYSSCIERGGASPAEIDSNYKDLLKSLPHFAEHGGRDHIFLWSSEFYDFPSWMDYMPNSVFLAVEAEPVECDLSYIYSAESADEFGTYCRHCSSCFTPWKDIVIPGFVESWSIRRMSELEVPSASRSLTVCYHGADSDHIPLYKHANATVRNKLQELRDLPNVSIGHRIPRIIDYFTLIGKCHFCFVPKGLGYWSNRLYEVIFAGCIPVLLSDKIGFPFDDLLNWTSFSIKWPMDEVSPALVEHLESLLAKNHSFVMDLHEGVRRNRCWLNYHSEEPGCSPYIGIVKSLEKRKAAFPRSHGKTWGTKAWVGDGDGR